MLKADCFCCFTAYCWVFLTSQSLKDWCPALLKPFFTPSNRLFFPSLDHVFVLMGIAFYLVWQEGFTSDRAVLYLHFIRLLVNVFWLLLFFGLRRPRFSFSGYPDYLSINFGFPSAAFRTLLGICLYLIWAEFRWPVFSIFIVCLN